MRTAVVLVMSAMLASADGGAVCLREASGPFLVTVFAPESLRAGPNDVSVLVQNRGTGGVILDAAVTFVIEPLAGKSPGIRTRATREQATNKLLKAARIDLPAPGSWALQVIVTRGGEEAVLATNLTVAPSASRLAAVWPLLLPPPFVILLFAIHQVITPRPHPSTEA
jgi:hypothetical protein